MSKHQRMNQGLNKPSFGSAPNCCEIRKLCRSSWLLLCQLIAKWFVNLHFIVFKIQLFYYCQGKSMMGDAVWTNSKRNRWFCTTFPWLCDIFVGTPEMYKSYTVESGVEYFHSIWLVLAAKTYTTEVCLVLQSNPVILRSIGFYHQRCGSNHCCKVGNSNCYILLGQGVK